MSLPVTFKEAGSVLNDIAKYFNPVAMDPQRIADNITAAVEKANSPRVVKEIDFTVYTDRIVSVLVFDTDTTEIFDIDHPEMEEHLKDTLDIPERHELDYLAYLTDNFGAKDIRLFLNEAYPYTSKYIWNAGN